MTLREERPGDADAIRAVVDAAFATAPHADGTEPAIVDRLRDQGGLTLSLVAVTADGTIVGHVAASPAAVGDAVSGWAGIGPVSVRPDRQSAGIGSALMRAALDRLKALGLDGAVLVGDPAFYGRFGFRAVPGLTVDGVPDGYVLAVAFDGRSPQGRIRFHPAFGLEPG
ncbi:MAG: GNAT family N-acetyltransferase [Alphaproteobacteria bacterium]|jgi:putative acetyltransferase|nr:GNAT family N-acetyltransferase [Alphaproteobacteria bacterium]